jgi:hypothetical protein
VDFSCRRAFRKTARFDPGPQEPDCNRYSDFQQQIVGG